MLVFHLAEEEKIDARSRLLLFTRLLIPDSAVQIFKELAEYKVSNGRGYAAREG